MNAPRSSGYPRTVRRLLLGVGLLGLAASLVANVILFRQFDRTYRELSATQLDPYGLAFTNFPPDVPAGDAARGLQTVAFFGDSRAMQWPAPAVADWRFVNRGIAGQTTAQVRGRFESHVAKERPKVLVLQAGINDLKAIGLFPDRRDEIVADCKTNLKQVVKQANDGGATVILTTIFPTGEVTIDRRLVWSPEIDRAVEEVNADLRTLASDRVIVLDAWQLLQNNGKLHDGLGKDTLHLNPQGYEVLNAELMKHLRNVP